MSVLELPLLGSMTSTGSNVDIVVAKENEMSKKHDKVHLKCNFTHYLLLLIVACAYFAYGYNKNKAAKEIPSIHSYQDNINTYPLPTSLACIKQNNSFLNIQEIDINDQTISIQNKSTNKDITYLQLNSSTSVISLETNNNDKWQIIKGNINELNYKCLMVIPPSNLEYMSLYQIKYIYWSKGFVDHDPYLSETLKFEIPSFMTMQDEYFMHHTHFHIDDFMQDRDDTFNDGDNENFENILYDAYNFGEPFYTTPFSYNAMRLQLEQTKKLNGDVLNSFDVGSNA